MPGQSDHSASRRSFANLPALGRLSPIAAARVAP
jgi:hypothetical protein